MGGVGVRAVTLGGLGSGLGLWEGVWGQGCDPGGGVGVRAVPMGGWGQSCAYGGVGWGSGSGLCLLGGGGWGWGQGCDPGGRGLGPAVTW